MENLKAKRPVMVVAHCDDESMWGAGLLLRNKLSWEVIVCTTPDRDPDRVKCFERACEVLGVKGRVINQREDQHRLRFDELDIDDADLIVTHNRDGEYGHKHHKEVHEYLTTKYTDKVLCFGYRPKNGSIRDFVIDLTPDECAAKMKAIQCYDNIGPEKRPTWITLINSFSHKFDLWREPYEKFRFLIGAMAADFLICRFPMAKIFPSVFV